MAHQILIVDDEEAILMAFKKLLASPNVLVDCAQTTEEAESCLKAKEYGVVIADLRLTGVLGEEGLEIIQYVKELNPLTHVVLVTGYGSPEIRDKAQNLGAHYFEKPVKASMLKDLLHNLGVS